MQNTHTKTITRTLAPWLVVLALAAGSAFLARAQDKQISPLTTMWGEDYKRAHPDWTRNVDHFYFVMLKMNAEAPAFEFGLRSDGVVVWRELPKETKL